MGQVINSIAKYIKRTTAIGLQQAPDSSAGIMDSQIYCITRGDG